MNQGIKIIGFLLLLLGIGAIVFVLWHSYNIFTGKRPVPQVFSEQDFLTTPLEKEEIDKSREGSEGLSEQDMEQMLREQIGGQFKEIIPPQVIAKLLNLVSWSIFAGICTFGGGKIAGVGISMLKKKKEKNES